MSAASFTLQLKANKWLDPLNKNFNEALTAPA
jgi:hypothetical protein